MSTSSTDFQESYNQTKSAVTGISTAIIVVIVLVVLAGIGSIIAGFCIWHRSKKRRERNLANQPTSNTSNYQYGGGFSYYNNNGHNTNQLGAGGDASTPFLAPHYSGQTEPLSSTNIYSRAEAPNTPAPNTPAPLPEVPGGESRHEKPYDTAYAELGHGEQRRSELP